jgi:hypothetical protein
MRESSFSDGESNPDYVSYLLRMWYESGAGESSDEEDKPTCRASVVSTLTGKRRGFANLDALFGFLQQQESTMLDSHVKHDHSEEGHKAQDTTTT